MAINQTFPVPLYLTSEFYRVIRESVDSLCRNGMDVQYMHKYAKSLFKHPAFLFVWFYDQQDSYSCPKASWKTAKFESVHSCLLCRTQFSTYVNMHTHSFVPRPQTAFVGPQVLGPCCSIGEKKGLGERGEYKVRQHKQLTVSLWQDNRPVMISTNLLSQLYNGRQGMVRQYFLLPTNLSVQIRGRGGSQQYT